jgi:glyoxylase-like metal-dependent hydrolase (beta-lactamase superfamily II)
MMHSYCQHSRTKAAGKWFAFLTFLTLNFISSSGYANKTEVLMKLISTGPNHAAYEFGNLTVIALRDGYVDMPVSRLQDEPGKSLDISSRNIPLVNGQLRLSVNAFVVIDGDSVVLVDTGASDSWLPSMGGLPTAMHEAGIEKTDITHVAVTHTHEDHVNGLISPDGSETFPNAKAIYVPAEEMSEIGRRFATLKSRITPIKDGFKITRHITAANAQGHSVGHTAYRVESDLGTLLIWGDIVHVPSVQFGQPEITWEFDNNQYQARGVRKRLLDQAAQTNFFIAGAHLDFPGIGSVTKSDGTSYSFSPIDGSAL